MFAFCCSDREKDDVSMMHFENEVNIKDNEIFMSNPHMSEI